MRSKLKKLKLNNKIYDILKIIYRYFLPAVSFLLVVLQELIDNFNLPASIVTAISIIAIPVLRKILSISQSNYYRDGANALKKILSNLSTEEK